MKHAELQAKKNNQTHKLGGCCQKKRYFGMSSSTKWSVHESLACQTIGRLPKFEGQAEKNANSDAFDVPTWFCMYGASGKG